VKVCLIVPNSSFLIDELVFPSLGVLKVAAVLEAEHDVRVLDLSGIANTEAAVLRDIAQHGAPDAYGITATMPQMPAAALIAQTLRAHTDARLILGGPHVTLMHSSARLEGKRQQAGRATHAINQLLGLFDVLVCGDGEIAITVALQWDSPQIIDADDATSPLFLIKEDFHEAKLPARHLIDLTRYHYAIDGVSACSAILQLGCPFGCTFCGGRNSPFLRRVRTRTSASVIAEMRQLYDTYGFRGFMFFDDELNVNPAFPELLGMMCDLQDELGVEFRLRGLLKSELLTPEMAAGMYRAGFRQILIGFESGHPRILENMQKRATREDNTRAVETLHAHGLKVKALMSLGHAGESAETIDATKQWLLDVQPDDFDATIITVYPGTPYWDETVQTAPGLYTYTAKNGDRLHGRHVDHLADVNFYKGVPHAYQSFVHTDALSAAELVTLRDDLEDDVRQKLGVPYPTAAAAMQYEHSMGQR
jgi:anaerobic magnesium-protoporphyrin IX monomethyl ester cyclase